jgi:hypothetical protein
LAQRHLRDAILVLYDLSSSYFEGHTCPIAMRGYSRDEYRGSLQIVYGLLCDRDGRPVAVEVFEGNKLDHQTVLAQIEKLKSRFELSRVVFVSDRGMVTTANLTALREKRIDWITALKAPQVKALKAAGALPLSLFDDRNLAEIDHAAFPDERLIVCRNPLLADERGRKRDALLRATEAKLQPIRERVERGTLHGKAKIGLAVGAVRDKYKMSKHIELEIDDAKSTFRRKEAQIAEEASLDGTYILRTTVDAQFSTGDVVRSYTELATIERAFRTMKSDDLAILPIHHWLEDRARAHIFLDARLLSGMASAQSLGAATLCRRESTGPRRSRYAGDAVGAGSPEGTLTANHVRRPSALVPDVVGSLGPPNGRYDDDRRFRQLLPGRPTDSDPSTGLGVRQDSSSFVGSNQPPIRSKQARHDGLVCLPLAVAPA